MQVFTVGVCLSSTATAILKLGVLQTEEMYKSGEKNLEKMHCIQLSVSNFQYPSQAKLLFQRFCCLTCANITQGVVGKETQTTKLISCGNDSPLN